MLLGLQLSVPAVLELGAGGIVVIAGTVAVTFSATLLIGRALRVPRVMTLLVATGFAICGAAAVAAMTAVVDPGGEHDDDTATAIGLVTLFGSVALTVATVTKLGRAVLLAPLVAGTGVALRAAVPERGADRPPVLPLFVGASWSR